MVAGAPLPEFSDAMQWECPFCPEHEHIINRNQREIGCLRERTDEWNGETSVNAGRRLNDPTSSNARFVMVVILVIFFHYLHGACTLSPPIEIKTLHVFVFRSRIFHRRQWQQQSAPPPSQHTHTQPLSLPLVLLNSFRRLSGEWNRTIRAEINAILLLSESEIFIRNWVRSKWVGVYVCESERQSQWMSCLAADHDAKSM